MRRHVIILARFENGDDGEETVEEEEEAVSLIGSIALPDIYGCGRGRCNAVLDNNTLD